MLFPLSFYTYLLCPLLMGTDIWQEIEVLNQEFVRLGISQSVDYEKYYLYSLITHSTAIEGSTLTELDTQLLFDEGVTAKGKPLVYHLMNEDLKKAYELAKEESAQNAEITPVFLQKLNAALMRTTGSVYNVMGGSFDSSKVGEYSAMKRAKEDKIEGTSELAYPDIDQEMHNKSRSYWNEVVTREAKNHGCVPFYWETGGDMNRGTGTAKEAYAIEGIMKGAAAGQYPY